MSSDARWERSARTWIVAQGTATVIEVSIGRRAKEILAAVERDGRPLDEVADELLELLRAIHAPEASTRIYTLRARRADGDPLASRDLPVPALEGGASAASTATRALEQTAAQLLKSNNDLVGQVQNLVRETHTGYAQLLRTLEAALASASALNDGLRASLREAQSGWSSALTALEAERASTKRWDRLAEIVGQELTDKSKTKKKLEGTANGTANGSSSTSTGTGTEGAS